MALSFLKNNSSIIILILSSWCLKFLLIPAYYSTDFAVHQNWLRITHQLPLSQWYTDTQSKWTLDYPPLFAYFQYVLSIIANCISPTIVKTINQLPQTIIFQRLSVILTDVFYLWSILKFTNYQINLRVVLMYLWIPFVILDNLHFQYNLLMQSILILCVGFMEQKKYLKSAFCYATLLNFKHIYLYCSPAFFFYLLKQYIFASNKQQSRAIDNTNKNNNIKKQQQLVSNQSSLNKLLKFLVVALIPFIVSFGPFFVIGGVPGIKQILSRMFPFSRGLIHHYWAPNFWALYYFIDKVLAILGFKSQIIYQIADNHNPVNRLKVLPQISPKITVIIILTLLTPIIISYFLSKKKVKFVKLVAICGLVFFMFGFHVHQKAIVPYLNVLFMFYSQTIGLNAAIFVNIVNLVPLLLQPKQKTFCMVVCLLWLTLWDFLDQNKRDKLFKIQQIIHRQFNFLRVKEIAELYIEYFIEISGVLIVVFQLFIHPMIKKPSNQFLPFMINSVWAAILNFIWIGYLYYKFVKQYAIDSRYKTNSVNSIEDDQQNSLLQKL